MSGVTVTESRTTTLYHPFSTLRLYNVIWWCACFPLIGHFVKHTLVLEHTHMVNIHASSHTHYIFYHIIHNQGWAALNIYVYSKKPGKRVAEILSFYLETYILLPDIDIKLAAMLENEDVYIVCVKNANERTSCQDRPYQRQKSNKKTHTLPCHIVCVCANWNVYMCRLRLGARRVDSWWRVACVCDMYSLCSGKRSMCWYVVREQYMIVEWAQQHIIIKIVARLSGREKLCIL